MIRRFDEVLLEKASKFALRELSTRMEQEYTTKQEHSSAGKAVEAQFKEMERKRSELEGMIQELSKATGREIFQAVRRATQ